MKIKDLYIDSFGPYRDFQITLNDTMTLLYGPNESGKTSIQYFIYGMFYGFVKSQLKTIRYTQMWERFKPLFYDEYRGRIHFVHNGKEYVLQRDFNAKTFQITDTNGKDLSETLEGYKASKLDFPGEFFFGITGDIFESLFLINYQTVHLEDTTRSKVKNFILDQSFDPLNNQTAQQAFLKIEKKLDEIGSPRAFSKPYGAALLMRDRLNEQYAQYSQNQKVHTELLNEMKFLHQQIKDNEKQIERYQWIDQNLRYNKSFSRMKKLKYLEAEIQKIKSRILKIEKIESAYQKKKQNFQQMDLYLNKNRENILELTDEKKRLLDVKKEMNNRILEYNANLKLFDEKERNVKKSRNLQIFRGILIFLMFFYGLFVFSFLRRGVLTLKLQLFYIPILFMILYLGSLKISPGDSDHQNTYNFSEFRDMNLNELKKMEEEYHLLESRIEKLDYEINESIMHEKHLDERKAHFLEQIYQDSPLPFKKNIEEYLQELAQLRAILKEKATFFQTLSSEDFEWMKDFEFDADALAQTHTEFYQATNYEDLLRQRDELKNRIYFIEKNHMKEMILLEKKQSVIEQLKEVEDKIDCYKKEYDALNNAKNRIQICLQSLRKTYLNKLDHLINQKYKSFFNIKKRSVILNEDFKLSLKLKNAALLSSQYLSHGLSCIMDILIRISIVDSCSWTKPVFIIDDLFDGLDDINSRLMLEFLRYLSRDYQIILFTHKTSVYDGYCGFKDNNPPIVLEGRYDI